jgi:fatty acid desaturase
MTRTEGSLDRIVRVTVGLAALLLALIGPLGGGWSWAVGAVGAILLVTGAVGFCPLYAVFGMRTCPAPPTERT